VLKAKRKLKGKREDQVLHAKWLAGNGEVLRNHAV
jgi:hypothetical protein